MTDTPTSDGPLPPDDSAANKAKLMVFLVVVIDLLGFGIVLPLLPRYAEMYIPENTKEIDKGLIIGGLFSCFSAMQFLFAPLWGRLSDRIGRRPVLLVGLAGSVVFYCLFGFASSLQGYHKTSDKPEVQAEAMAEPPEVEYARLGLILLFVSRIGAGMAGATISTAAAVIADTTTKEGRAKGMALIGAAFGLGFTFGPLIAWAGDTLFFGAKSGPGYLAAFLSLAALILAIRLMPETCRGRAAAKRRDLWRLHGLAQVLRTPKVGALVVTYFLVVFAFSNFEGTLALFTQDDFGYTDQQNYLVFAFVGASLMIAQGVIYRRLVGKWGELLLARIGVALMALGLGGLVCIAWMAASHTTGLLAAFLIILFVSVCGFAFLNPSINAMISRRSDPTRQGEVLGVNQSASAMARILGPAVGNALFRMNAQHDLPYVVAAVLLLGVLAGTWKLGDGT